jgi:predicted DNA-binding transcriptional regulator AlpA
MSDSVECEIGFYDPTEVEGLTKLSPAKRRALIKAGKFPPGLLIGRRTKVWPRSSIHSWVQEQIRLARENDDLDKAARLAGARMVQARRAKRAGAEAVTGERRVGEVVAAATP